MSLIRKVATYLVLALTGLACVSPAYAAPGVAKLAIHVTDPSHRNTYFICIADFGCYSILASEAHKSFPVITGNVDALFTTDVFTRRMYSQQIPASCKVQLHHDQTLEVYGKLNVSNSKVQISGLHCKVA